MSLSDFLGLYRFKTPKTIDELAKIADTPEKLSDWITNRVWYTKDENDGQDDYWQNSQETLDRKKGDCEDYASIYRDVLRKQGYKAKIVDLVVDDDSREGIGYHAVTAYQDKEGNWRLMDCNGGLQPQKAATIKELIEMQKKGYRVIEEYPEDAEIPCKDWHELQKKSLKSYLETSEEVQE